MWQRWDYAKSSRRETKFAVVNIVKPWMISDVYESKNPSSVGSAMCPKWPKKVWGGDTCWLHPRESGPRSPKHQQVEWLHLQPCLVPSWCGVIRTVWSCSWSWGISSPPRIAAPTTLPRGSGYENERIVFLAVISGRLRWALCSSSRGRRNEFEDKNSSSKRLTRNTNLPRKSLQCEVQFQTTCATFRILQASWPHLSWFSQYWTLQKTFQTSYGNRHSNSLLASLHFNLCRRNRVGFLFDWVDGSTMLYEEHKLVCPRWNNITECRPGFCGFPAAAFREILKALLTLFRAALLVCVASALTVGSPGLTRFEAGISSSASLVDLRLPWKSTEVKYASVLMTKHEKTCVKLFFEHIFIYACLMNNSKLFHLCLQLTYNSWLTASLKHEMAATLQIGKQKLNGNSKRAQ